MLGRAQPNANNFSFFLDQIYRDRQDVDALSQRDLIYFIGHRANNKPGHEEDAACEELHILHRSLQILLFMYLFTVFSAAVGFA